VVVAATTSQVDQQPPAVTVVSPADGATVPRAQVPLLATATDNVGVAQVEFFVDGISQGTSAATPFTVNWDASAEAEGSAHTILALATDAASNVGHSQSVTVTIEPAPAPDVVPPSVSIVSPPDGTEVFQGLGNTLMAVALDNVGVARVEFFVDGGSAGVDSSAPFSINWTTNAPFGSQHTIYAIAYDLEDNAGFSDVVVAQVAIPDYYINLGPMGSAPTPQPVFTRDPVNSWGSCSGVAGSSGFDLTWGPLPAGCSVVRFAWENACANGGTVTFNHVDSNPAATGTSVFSSTNVCFHCFNYSGPIILPTSSPGYIRVVNPSPGQIISRIAIYCL
jgi:hypothetical protein